MPPRRGNRSSLVDDDALLASTAGRDSDYQNFSIDDSRVGAARGDGVMGTMKGWWADDRKRKLIIGSVIAGVVLLIVIIAIAAAAANRDRGSGGGGGASSSSTGGGTAPPPPPDMSSSSSSTADIAPVDSSSSSSSTGGMAPVMSSSSSSSSAPMPPPNPNYPWLSPRLPSVVSPTRYKLEQTIDIDQRAYGGVVDISLGVAEFIDHLVIHSVGLTHTSINFTNEVGGSVPFVSWYYAPNSYLVLNFTQRVPPQTDAKLSIAFTGTLRLSPLTGLYLSTYQDGAGAPLSYMASTQFESIGARRAFPCFDEPAMKATFSIAISNPAAYPTVLSNMPGVTTPIPNDPTGALRTVFDTTPKMSTYLVAYVVTDYVYSEQITACTTSDGYSANITSRVWALRSQYNATIVPARIAAAQIAYYCRYFDVAYPLPKEDHVYIPAFSAGAMENWGLITYRDTALLWDPAINNVAQLQRVAVVIAHELGHQWFGNLVTAAWWSSLWLNEGFATFVEYIGSGYSNPELQMADQFISVALREALAYDSGRSSHPIITDMNPTGAFDSVTYAKGGSVIRMMEGVLTRPVFLAGIKRYLQSKAYGNAVSTDLFYYLDQASAAAGQAFNVTDFMYEWTARAGYPLVNCSTTVSVPDATIYWTCTQSRFFTYAPAPASDTLWQIPLTGISSLGVELYGFWSQLNSTYTFNQPVAVPWLKLNHNTTGFYRVLYSPLTYSQLSQALNQPGFGGIAHDDRLGLVGDMAVFASQSLLTYTQVLNASLFLQHDRAFTVWQVAHPVLVDLYNRLRYTEARSDMYQYMQQALSTAAGSINLRNNTAAADQILENVIGTSMIRFNAAGKRDQLQAMWQQFYSSWPLVSFTDLAPNLAALVLQAAVADGSIDDWRFMYDNLWVQKLLGSVDPLPAVSSYTTLTVILAAPRDPAVLQAVLNTLNATAGLLFNSDDTVALLVALASNADGGLALFNSWIQQPALPDGTPAVFQALNQTLPASTFSQLIANTLALNVRQSEVDQLSQFYRSQAVPWNISAAVTAGAARAAGNIAWAASYAQPLVQYLASSQWRTPAVSSSSSSSTGGMAPVMSSSSSSSSAPMPPPNPNYPWLSPRLPSVVSPTRYKLEQTIDIDQRAYGGVVDISLGVAEFIDHLVIHSVGLTHTSINFTNEVGGSVPFVSWYYAPNSYLVLNFTQRVPPQTDAKLSIAFTGTLRLSPLTGLYLSTYQDGAGAPLSYMASTQFESIGARRAFPCFDEPAMKATFSIAISNPAAYPTVLSNMPGVTTPIPNDPTGALRTVFDTTPKMSTYLVAYVVTDYVYSEQITACTTSDGYSANITSRVWALRSQYNATIVPARIAAAQIAYYCRYFDVAYPLPKEDHVYIPAFSAGAMENWGLITYRDTALLWDPAINNVAQLQRVAVVIAHELGHQWFGNLVTAAWWSSLWLNEGFATFVEYIGSGYSNPELQMADQFISVALREALAYDSGRSSHPIITDMNPTGAFDSVTYAKGGSVIRMMEGVLTRPVFLAGIKRYLQSKAYGNAVSTDLFYYLDQASAAAGQAFNVTDFMYEWTARAGYPLVNCSTTVSVPDATIYWTCTQSRFFTYAPAPASDTLWQIPLTGISSLGVELYGFWSQLNSTYTFNQPVAVPWLKLNHNTTGFYRVLYSPLTYSQLSQALNQPGFGGIAHDDRLGLVGDMAVFASQSLLTYTQVLNASLFLQHDRAFTVWQVAHPVLVDLYNRLRYTEARSDMYQYMQQALSTAAGSINLRNNTAAADQILENVIGTSMIRFNAAGKRDQLQAMWQQFYSSWPLVSFTDLAPNLAALVLQAAVADGSIDDWRFMYDNLWVQKLLGSVDPLPAVSSYTTLTVILAAPRDPAVLQAVLNTLNATAGLLFNSDDTVALLVALASNADGGLALFNSWIQQPALPDGTPAVFQALNQTLPASTFSQLIANTLALNVRQSEVDQLSQFYRSQAVPWNISAAVTAGAARAAGNIAWAASYAQPLVQYLASSQWRTPAVSSSSSSSSTSTPRPGPAAPSRGW